MAQTPGQNNAVDAAHVPDATALARAPYVSLVTYRRSGAAVATPVWCAADGDDFFVFSAGNAGKMKRLRIGQQAACAICDVRGKRLSGERPARAEIITAEADIARALAALRRKYGWQMWLADTLSRLTGKMSRRGYIRFRLTSLTGADAS
jgi:PPOX class probable F420-dependent enzyme